VPVGSKVRATSTLTDTHDIGAGTVQITVTTVIEIEGGAKPACVAESILRYIS
jgi:acyl dehydratase